MSVAAASHELRKASIPLPDCYHCGTRCLSNKIRIEDKLFCCEGCALVYELLNTNGLCDYYKLQNHPGLTQIKPIRGDKYAYLDNETIAAALCSFSNGSHTIITLYLPGVHCSSCMWLLEHLHKINAAVTESRLNFSSKEVTIHFNSKMLSLRKLVELLAAIGYEPHISLKDMEQKKGSSFRRQDIIKLGLAGFCFGNIMMLSFPEYLSLRENAGHDAGYASLFRWLNLLFALPVFFYCASGFFITAWKGIRQKTLNIDAPIALAVLITFGRSIYEIVTGSGAGYLDSMSGIIFFMLVGRMVQERTYRSLSFHRDYKSYFPIAVQVITPGGILSRQLNELKEKDMVQLQHDDLVPADARLISGNARIDYSFVTGESEPVHIQPGEKLYAGGKQTADKLVIQIEKTVAGSYLTSLWNHYAFSRNKIRQNRNHSMLHLLSKYFTVVLLILAGITAIYWSIHDPSVILPAITAMLIVACPCALLLTATFTNGNLMRIFSNNGLFLRDASVIEQLGKIDHIVFDKTGTLTDGKQIRTKVWGDHLDAGDIQDLYQIAIASKHPYSKALTTYLGAQQATRVPEEWAETAGAGVAAVINGRQIKMGSASFTGLPEQETASLYVRIDNIKTIFFGFTAAVRPAIPGMIPALRKKGYHLSLLSGDKDRERKKFEQLFHNQGSLLFGQKPIDKLQYVENLQQKAAQVMMVGDGLNDAGALQQSNVGITLADDVNNFTPSCDAILDARFFDRLPALMQLSRSAKRIIYFCFAVSILYNITGLYFSMQGQMRPLIAAILMPTSTLTIVLITWGLTSWEAYRLGLTLKNETDHV